MTTIVVEEMVFDGTEWRSALRLAVVEDEVAEGYQLPGAERGVLTFDFC